MQLVSAAIVYYVISAVLVERVLSMHLSQIGARDRSFHQANSAISTPSPQPKSHSFQRSGMNSGTRTFFSNAGTSNSMVTNLHRTAPVIQNTNINRNVNNNYNFNDGLNVEPNVHRMMPISHSVNSLIQQQILTRQILINLLRKQLLDMNGRYTQNPSARGTGFVDPRTIFKPEPVLPNLEQSNSNSQNQGSITIESTGSFTISEVKGPDGQSQIVIDTRKKPSATPKKSKGEEPPEAA